jgi:peptidoglycan/LPS O-acetylase OafA/YrhL
MKKRPDIQGLRAVAVLLVIVYHAGFNLPGGFDGVDIFFVISGFVITGTLLNELTSTGRISISRFYVRRIKRLLPAAALMLAFVALVGALADPAGAQRISALTGVFTALFTSNLFLAHLPTGYFNVGTTSNPLLHTWTLGVEEQFYIVFPLVLLGAWWLGRKLVRGHSREISAAVIAIFCVGSFLFSRELYYGHFFGRLMGIHGLDPKLAFYSSPTRAWEFGVGALVVLAVPLLSRLPQLGAYVLGSAGAIAIGVSAFTLNAATFRETSALLPVGGACLLLAAGAVANVGFSRILSTSPMVWIGDISYGLYLWHWPLIVFARALFPGQGWAPSVAAAASFLPSWLSYRYVENPIRFHARLGSRSLVAGRTAAALASVCIAIPVFANIGLLQVQKAFSATTAMKSWKRAEVLHSYVGRGCGSWVPLGQKTNNQRCIWRVRQPHGMIYLLGDSNAGQFTEPVTRAGNRVGYDVTVATPSSCPYVGLRLTRIDGENKLCPPFGTESLKFLARSKASLVVLATRTDFYLQNPVDGLGVVGKGGLTFNDKAKARLWRRTLGAELRMLNEARVPVLLINPVPVLPVDPSTCAVVRVLTGTCAGSLPRSAVDKWLRLAITSEDAAAATAQKTWVLNFENQLCGKNRCSTNKNGITLYRDSRHLSVDGSLYLTGTIQRAIAAHAVRRK